MSKWPLIWLLKHHCRQTGNKRLKGWAYTRQPRDRRFTSWTYTRWPGYRRLTGWAYTRWQREGKLYKVIDWEANGKSHESVAGFSVFVCPWITITFNQVKVSSWRRRHTQGGGGLVASSRRGEITSTDYIICYMYSFHCCFGTVRTLTFLQ